LIKVGLTRRSSLRFHHGLQFCEINRLKISLPNSRFQPQVSKFWENLPWAISWRSLDTSVAVQPLHIHQSIRARFEQLLVLKASNILRFQPTAKVRLFSQTLSLQLGNGETGLHQQEFSGAEKARFISVDATSSGSRLPLPAKWDSALFDARSWDGPAGISILAIANRAEFTYPLPHIAPISVPGSYSLPLLIASSIALDLFEDASTLMRDYLIYGLQKIEGVEVVGAGLPALNNVLSCVVKGVRNEAIVRQLAAQGIDVDAGSACSPEDLQPSHVIASMGFATDGHLRFTLRSETTTEEIDVLLAALQKIISHER
jgi:cysteine desulfurase